MITRSKEAVDEEPKETEEEIKEEPVIEEIDETEMLKSKLKRNKKNICALLQIWKTPERECKKKNMTPPVLL